MSAVPLHVQAAAVATASQSLPHNKALRAAAKTMEELSRVGSDGLTGFCETEEERVDRLSRLARAMEGLMP